jgi:FkbM family methyltransferase
LIKKLIYSIVKLILIFEKIVFFFTKKKFSYLIHEYLDQNVKHEIIFSGKKILFCGASYKAYVRASTLFTKEKDTINWIDKFNSDKIFWDIGANVGIYSLYGSKIHENLKVVSFEPSFNNLQLLSRNIFLNNMNQRIKICQLPIIDKKIGLENFNEFFLEQGSSGFHYHDGHVDMPKNKKIPKLQNQSLIIATNLDFYYENKILDIPNYIKIDVDGIEYDIIKSGEKIFSNDKVESCLIEINLSNYEAANKIYEIMKSYGFVHTNDHGYTIFKNYKSIKNNSEYYIEDYSYNEIFIKKK